MQLDGFELAMSDCVQGNVTCPAADKSAASSPTQAAQAAQCSAIDSILLSHIIIECHVTESWSAYGT